MTAPSHPVGQEEVMAYLDAELLPERAAFVSAHLETCDACRDLATQFRSVSAQMATWEIERAPDSLAQPVEAALTTRPHEAAKAGRGGWLIIPAFSIMPLTRRLNCPSTATAAESAFGQPQTGTNKTVLS